jgi:ABC-type dipeptide/oligopeptide/nickel transport system permease component
MLAFVCRRLGQAVLVVLGAATLAFVVIRLLPGDPVEAMFANLAVPQAVQDRIRAEMRMDEPLPAQYLYFLTDLAQGRLGTSMLSGEQVGAEIGAQVGSTLQLAALGILLALLFGFACGILAARRPDGWLDRVITAAQMVFVSMPVFWVGIVLLAVFSFNLAWFPATGNAGVGALVLPALTLALPTSAIIGQLVRDGLRQVLWEPYVVTARAKGLGEWSVLYRHALRNSLVPVVTVLGMVLGGLLSGAVVVETIFARPGLGRLALGAILAKDYPMVQAIVVIAALAYVTINVAVDVAYAAIDPRIR